MDTWRHSEIFERSVFFRQERKSHAHVPARVRAASLISVPALRVAIGTVIRLRPKPGHGYFA